MSTQTQDYPPGFSLDHGTLGHRFDGLPDDVRSAIQSCDGLWNLGFYDKAAQRLGSLDLTSRKRPVVAVAIAKNLLTQGNTRAAGEAIDLALNVAGSDGSEFFELLVLHIMRANVQYRVEGPSDGLHSMCQSIFNYIENLAPTQYMEVTVDIEHWYHETMLLFHLLSPSHSYYDRELMSFRLKAIIEQLSMEHRHDEFRRLYKTLCNVAVDPSVPVSCQWSHTDDLSGCHRALDMQFYHLRKEFFRHPDPPIPALHALATSYLDIGYPGGRLQCLDLLSKFLLSKKETKSHAIIAETIATHKEFGNEFIALTLEVIVWSFAASDNAFAAAIIKPAEDFVASDIAQRNPTMAAMALSALATAYRCIEDLTRAAEYNERAACQFDLSGRPKEAERHRLIAESQQFLLIHDTLRKGDQPSVTSLAWEQLTRAQSSIQGIRLAGVPDEPLENAFRACHDAERYCLKQEYDMALATILTTLEQFDPVTHPVEHFMLVERQVYIYAVGFPDDHLTRMELLQEELPNVMRASKKGTFPVARARSLQAYLAYEKARSLYLQPDDTVKARKQLRMLFQGDLEEFTPDDLPGTEKYYNLAMGFTWLPKFKIPKIEAQLLPTLESIRAAIYHFRCAERQHERHAARVGVSRILGDGLEIYQHKRRINDLYHDEESPQELVLLACMEGFLYCVAHPEVEGSPDYAFELSMDAWKITQDIKARGLIETLAIGSTFPASALAVVEHSPALNDLIQQEESLLKEIHTAQTQNTLPLWQRIDTLRDKMREDETLRHLLQAREGVGASCDDVKVLQEYSSRRSIVFVDWVITRSEIYVVMITGSIVFLQPVVGLSEQDVIVWRSENLRTEIMNSRIGESVLQDLRPLVAPLLSLSEPDDLLVLCPTGPLHGLPLHAIEIEPGKILIERNPVVYTPSIAILRHCLNGLILHRGQSISQSESTDAQLPEFGTKASFSAQKNWKAAIMSFYESDKASPAAEVKEVQNHIHMLSQTFNTTPALGDSLTVTAFSNQVAGANLIHFHGHASFNADDICSQSLLLASGHLSDAERHMTVAKIFELKLSAPHVSNIACDSGRQDIGHGDETLGITSAFLYAGASSVLGTLWPTSSACGRAFSTKFYESFRVSEPVELAVALQDAVLAIRDTEGTDDLYHWAGFVLYGLWFCPPVLTTT